MLGFGVMQLAYGPISDVVGRRPTLTIGLTIYALGCLLAAVAPSFQVLLAARVIQGMGVAACRVLAVAIVRDCYSGREMARVMSLTFAVFIIVPVFARGSEAPCSCSELAPPVREHADPRSGRGGVVRAAHAGDASSGVPDAFGRPDPRGRQNNGHHRVAIGYSTAVGLMFACIMAYVGSAQQIFESEV